MHLPLTWRLLESQRARSTIMLDKLMLLLCLSDGMAVPYLLVAGMADEHHHLLAETEVDR